jgi:ribulose-5-phosphate 4-epimerase/fuculose-1-phosphate aldolase
MRLNPGAFAFIVTGTQTGALAVLDETHYSIVTECDAVKNRLRAHGPIAPSSESLTHGQLYALDAAIQFVFHLHSPQLWRGAAALGIPTTAVHAEYGTPQMVAEVERLMNDTDAREKRLFAMGGHEDGIVSFGATAEEAGSTILYALARAIP